MIVAQCLVKALLLPWQWGERHLRHQGAQLFRNNFV